MAPWADVLFAMDVQWWKAHIAEVRQGFSGAKVSSSNLVRQFGVEYIAKSDRFEAFGNSGAACVSLAASWGASKIIMLGYDCQRTNGMAHWHGDHPKGLGNAGAMGRWPDHFTKLAAKWAGKVDIVNCSRQTALTCFRRGTLEQEIAT